jgi:hypothetical protein
LGIEKRNIALMPSTPAGDLQIRAEADEKLAGFKDASEVQNVIVAMIGHRSSADEIKKIWGGNFLRDFGEVQRLGQASGKAQLLRP